MSSRKGYLLEKNVEKLLELSGFQPELNKIYNNYEIDVFLRYKGYKIAFECKQYERSSLAIRNLIHQWNSKNEELNFDRVILVLIGCDISEKDRYLARKYNINIWDEEKLNELLNKSIEKKEENKDNILNEIGIELSQERKGKRNKDIIKKSLDKMLNKGIRGKSFLIFKDKNTDFYVQYSFEERGFMLFFIECPLISKEQIKSVKELLESYQFEDAYLKRNIIDSKNLNEKEFIFNKKWLGLFGNTQIDAQFGENIDFIAFLTDRILKEIFKSKDSYEIEIKFELNNY